MSDFFNAISKHPQISKLLHVYFNPYLQCIIFPGQYGGGGPAPACWKLKKERFKDLYCYRQLK